MVPNKNGMITIPEGPGLGLTVNGEAIARYQQDVQIKVNHHIAFESIRR